MSDQGPIKLKVPRQELDRSSYFDCEEQAVSQWIADLPIANRGKTTRQLYLALTELNRVRMLPSTRLAILDKLRTPIYYVSRGLSKHYLNQPIILPDQSRKVAELAHTLHLQLATGYTIVATHTAALGKRAKLSKPGTVIATALHRAITDHSLNILRHYQLYQSINSGVWHNLHQFYNLARHHQVQLKTIVDPEYGSSTIENNYIRAMLLGCSKPNQLRQEDVTHFFIPMVHWADLCRLQPAVNGGLFAIDPDSDQPPVYRELCEAEVPTAWLSLNTEKMIEHLNQLQDNNSPDTIKIEDNGFSISRDLLSHLALSWGSLSKRTFTRLKEHDSLDICIGISATHHFASGEISFEALVEKRGAKTFSMQHENPFIKTQSHPHRQKDVWSSPYEANVGQTSVPLESVDFSMRKNETRAKQKSKYRRHHVPVVNSSAHGYCINWPEDAEALIKTGEVVGIRDPRTHNWSIAAIRWVSQEDDQTRIGLELISPTVTAYGARIVHKTGGPNEYMRVLVLPELPSENQPITLLTPRMPFRSGQKVILNQRANELLVQLGEKLNTAGAYNQFEFRRVKGLISPDSDDGKPTDDFDALWKNL